jgi:hypothetical protein
MDKNVTLELNVNQLNIVLGGLAKLPIEVALETFNVIQQQASSQLGQPKGPLSDKVVN